MVVKYNFKRFQQMINLIWESNPYVYGCIEARVFSHKSAIGATWIADNMFKGHYLGKEVYAGENEDDAMNAVNNEHKKLCEEYPGYFGLQLRGFKCLDLK